MDLQLYAGLALITICAIRNIVVQTRTGASDIRSATGRIGPDYNGR